MPLAPALPNWEDNEEPNEIAADHPSTSYLEDNLSDDDTDDEDPFINLLERKDEGDSGTSVSKSENENKRKRPTEERKVKRYRNDRTNLNPVFCEPSIMGVEPCSDPDEVSRIQTLVQMHCGWKG